MDQLGLRRRAPALEMRSRARCAAESMGVLTRCHRGRTLRERAAPSEVLRVLQQSVPHARQFSRATTASSELIGAAPDALTPFPTSADFRAGRSALLHRRCTENPTLSLPEAGEGIGAVRS